MQHKATAVNIKFPCWCLHIRTSQTEVGSNKVHLLHYIYMSKCFWVKSKYKSGSIYFTTLVMVVLLLHFNAIHVKKAQFIPSELSFFFLGHAPFANKSLFWDDSVQGLDQTCRQNGLNWFMNLFEWFVHLHSIETKPANATVCLRWRSCWTPAMNDSTGMHSISFHRSNTL